uniref:Uncharacterized protein n=1 Tax=Periophthalmus magnuspinnatus TaxID=409849 RepID=A0A3B4APL9_9GOBI
MSIWRLYLLCALLCTAGVCHDGTQTKDYKIQYSTYFSMTEKSNEKRLINDLHEVLERLQNNQFPSMRKKQGHLPMCEPGDKCALRKGSRIGKLCDCSLPRTCNSFLHRCL